MHEVNGGCKQLLVGKMLFPPYFLEPGFLALKKLLVLWPQGQKSISSLKKSNKSNHQKTHPPKNKPKTAPPGTRDYFATYFIISST